MAKGQEVRVGPWPQGINLLDDGRDLEEGQLLTCLNFDVDNTGLLVPRRGFRGVTLPARGKIPTGANMGSYFLCGQATLKNETYPRCVLAAWTQATNTTVFSFVRDPSIADTADGISVPGQFRAVVSYLDKFWYVPAQATAVGFSTPTEIPTLGTKTDVSAIPFGDQAIILKDRLFVIRKATSEIYFSKVSDFTIWAAPDGGLIKVNPGDNQPITKVVSLNNQLIIFKRDSTFVLSYSANPVTDGTLRQVSADQGAADAITYNNEIYCYNERSVFKFVNGFFSDIGLQLNMTNRDKIDVAALITAGLSVVGKTLVFGRTPAGNVYGMNLDTGAWTMYKATSVPSLVSNNVASRSSGLGTAVFFGDGGNEVYYCAVARSGTQISDTNFAGTTNVLPEYEFRTKEYDFDDAQSWKRAHAWYFEYTSNVANHGGTSETYINGSRNNDTPDLTGLIGGGTVKSYRFKTTSMGLKLPQVTATNGTDFKFVMRGIKAVISAKAAVNT